MRNILQAAVLIAGAALRLPAADPWLLPNFAQRLELTVRNQADLQTDAIASIPVTEAAQVALRFPGTLAIAVVPGARPEILPTQVIDIDGNGAPDEFLVAVPLGPREAKPVHVYYSTTLQDSLPWPKRVHASHAYGYNHATMALESELVGYRTYGGFFLDIQARPAGRTGLNNSLVGYFGTAAPASAGIDIIHLGDTLGLGGLFLRAGTDVYRPPLNMPDYAHKPESPQAPRYRVIADGPLRALVEARIDRWTIGSDEVAIRALYSIDAGQRHVDVRFEITPVRISRTYEVGAGVRHLPSIKLDRPAGRIVLTGVQTPKIGPLGLALYYNPADADAAAPLATREDQNEVIVFHSRLEPGRAATGRYQLAGAWSGSGIPDLLTHLNSIDAAAKGRVTVDGYQATRTPSPERVEGEAH